MTGTIRYLTTGNRVIAYELTRKRVKNINLRIRNDGTVAVSCSRYVSVAQVENFLLEKADFILKAIDRVSERAAHSARPVEYEDGETVSVFGDRYTLRIRYAPRKGITVSDSEVIIYTPKPDVQQERARIYSDWRRMELKSKVSEMCEYYYPAFEKMGVKRPREIRFRAMKSRWGVCRPESGIVTFSFNLFETPDDAIEYVVVHEFAHFLEANHSARFYRIVEQVLPDWKRRRKLLNDY